RRLRLNTWPPRLTAWPHLTDLQVDAPATLTDLMHLIESGLLPRLDRLGLVVEGLRVRGLTRMMTAGLDGLARPALRLRLGRFEEAALVELLRHPHCRRVLTALGVGPVGARVVAALASGPLWDAMTDLDLEVSAGAAADELVELLRSPAL